MGGNVLKVITAKIDKIMVSNILTITFPSQNIAFNVNSNMKSNMENVHTIVQNLIPTKIQMVF